MPDPIQTQLLDEIGRRLKIINTANGYFSDVHINDVHRAKLTPFKGDDLPAINYWSSDTITERKGHGYSYMSFSVEIEMHTKTNDRPFTDVTGELSADITIALYRDDALPKVSDQPSFKLGDMVDGLNIDTIAPQIGEGQSPYCGVLVSISITYRVKAHDPFTIIT